MLHYEAVVPRTLELLRSLSALAEFEPFELVGGTALALHLGHRQSIDLDFFTDNDFDAHSLLTVIEKNHKTMVSNITSNSLNLTADDIKLDILSHKYPKLQKSERHDNITIASVQDIAAMKMNAATNRGSKKDFYDLYFLIERFGLKRLIDYFEKKYTNISTVLVLKSLVYFEDAELDPNPMLITSLDWEQVKRKMEEEVKLYF